jgi:hypothetical protein
MADLIITVQCGEKKIDLRFTGELIQDLKGVMGLDLHKELMNIILTEVDLAVKQALTDNKDSLL